MEYSQLIGIVVMTIIAFAAWLAREKIGVLDNVERRTTLLEAKLNVLGDINEVLGSLKTDIAVIKNSLENKNKDK